MNVVKYLLPMLMVQPCMAAMVSGPLAMLVNKEGAFEVCDVHALSDGGTTSICVTAGDGKFWFSKRNDAPSEWVAVYETDRQEDQRVAISAPEIDALLFSWVKYRYSCTAIRDMQSHAFQPSTNDGLIAATIMDLIHPTAHCHE